MTEPLVFTPLFMERVWGGRRLELVLGKALPPEAVIGESWEIVDRPEAQSVVAEGAFAGRTLHELWNGPDRSVLFGTRAAAWGDRFPLLIKGAAGGGGKGMQIVRDPAKLADAIATARRESERYFGDGRLFAERFVERPRHIEVQVFGDAHGHVIHLGERECSIQRRFQKLIEETPAPGLDPSLRQRMLENRLAVALISMISMGHHILNHPIRFARPREVGNEGEVATRDQLASDITAVVLIARVLRQLAPDTLQGELIRPWIVGDVKVFVQRQQIRSGQRGFHNMNTLVLCRQ